MNEKVKPVIKTMTELNTPQSNLMKSLSDIFASYYSSQHSEAIKAGIHRKKELEKERAERSS